MRLEVLSDILPPGLDTYVGSFLVTLRPEHGFHVQVNTIDDLEFWSKTFNINFDIRQMSADLLVDYVISECLDSFDVKFELMMRGDRYYSQIFSEPLISRHMGKTSMHEFSRLARMRRYHSVGETKNDLLMRHMMDSCSFIHVAENILAEMFFAIYPHRRVPLTHEQLRSLMKGMNIVIKTHTPTISSPLEILSVHEGLFIYMMHEHVPCIKSMTDDMLICDDKFLSPPVLAVSKINYEAMTEHVIDHLADTLYIESLLCPRTMRHPRAIGNSIITRVNPLLSSL